MKRFEAHSPYPTRTIGCQFTYRKAVKKMAKEREVLKAKAKNAEERGFQAE